MHSEFYVLEVGTDDIIAKLSPRLEKKAANIPYFFSR